MIVWNIPRYIGIAASLERTNSHMLELSRCVKVKVTRVHVAHSATVFSHMTHDVTMSVLSALCGRKATQDRNYSI